MSVMAAIRRATYELFRNFEVGDGVELNIGTPAAPAWCMAKITEASGALVFSLEGNFGNGPGDTRVNVPPKLLRHIGGGDPLRPQSRCVEPPFDAKPRVGPRPGKQTAVLPQDKESFAQSDQNVAVGKMAQLPNSLRDLLESASLSSTSVYARACAFYNRSLEPLLDAVDQLNTDTQAAWRSKDAPVDRNTRVLPEVDGNRARDLHAKFPTVGQRVNLSQDEREARLEIIRQYALNGILLSELALENIMDPNATCLAFGFPVNTGQNHEGYVAQFMSPTGFALAASMHWATQWMQNLRAHGIPVVFIDVLLEALHWNTCNEEGFTLVQQAKMRDLGALIRRAGFSVTVAFGRLSQVVICPKHLNERGAEDVSKLMGVGHNRAVITEQGKLILSMVHTQNCIGGWSGPDLAEIYAHGLDQLFFTMAAIYGKKVDLDKIGSMVGLTRARAGSNWGHTGTFLDLVYMLRCVELVAGEAIPIDELPIAIVKYAAKMPDPITTEEEVLAFEPKTRAAADRFRSLLQAVLSHMGERGGKASTLEQGKVLARLMGVADEDIAAADEDDLRELAGMNLGFTDGSEGGTASTLKQGKALARLMGMDPDDIAAADEDDLRALVGMNLGFTFGREGGKASTLKQGKALARLMGAASDDIAAADENDLRELTGMNLGFTFGRKGRVSHGKVLARLMGLSEEDIAAISDDELCAFVCMNVQILSSATRKRKHSTAEVDVFCLSADGTSWVLVFSKFLTFHMDSMSVHEHLDDPSKMGYYFLRFEMKTVSKALFPGFPRVDTDRFQERMVLQNGIWTFVNASAFPSLFVRTTPAQPFPPIPVPGAAGSAVPVPVRKRWSAEEIKIIREADAADGPVGSSKTSAKRPCNWQAVLEANLGVFTQSSTQIRTAEMLKERARTLRQNRRPKAKAGDADPATLLDDDDDPPASGGNASKPKPAKRQKSLKAPKKPVSHNGDDDDDVVFVEQSAHASKPRASKVKAVVQAEEEEDDDDDFIDSKPAKKKAKNTHDKEQSKGRLIKKRPSQKEISDEDEDDIWEENTPNKVAKREPAPPVTEDKSAKLAVPSSSSSSSSFSSSSSSSSSSSAANPKSDTPPLQHQETLPTNGSGNGSGSGSKISSLLPYMPVADTDTEPVEPQLAATEPNAVPEISADGEWVCGWCTYVNEYTLFDVKCGCCAEPSGLPLAPRAPRKKVR